MYFDSKKLTYLDVEKFLNQFPKNLQLSALNLINNIKILPNDELVSEIKAIVEEINSKNSNNVKIGILPLGSYMSSSSYMMKSYRNFLDHYDISQLSFSDEEQFLSTNYIIFVDDNINTGRQALNIIAKMFKINKSDLQNDKLYLEEIHVNNGEGEKIISNNIINHIKKTPLKFIFITGYETSAKDLKGYLTKYCELSENNLEVRIKYVLCENDKFFSGGSLTNDSNKSKNNIFREIKNNFKQGTTETVDLKNFLESIGAEVVKNRSICKKYEQDSKNHCLGYCNRESLVIFSGSVPTMTITALWCDGKYENGTKEWKAIIPRPIKGNH